MNTFDIKGSIVLLALSLVIALAVNQLSPAGIPLKGQWNPEKGVVAADPGKVLKAEELNNPLTLLRMIEAGSLVLIDARHEQAFAQGHLPGALSFPLHRFDRDLPAIEAALQPGKKTVIYCSGVECRDSHKFATRLMATGIREVLVYAGGFAEWEEMAFEVETGND